VLGGLAHGQEVRHNVGHQVRTHLYGGVEVILKQTARQRHRFYLRNTGFWSERNGEEKAEVKRSMQTEDNE